MVTIAPVLDTPFAKTDPTNARLEDVTFDLYRDVHKGIRAELFAVALRTGQTDPQDESGTTEIVTRLNGLLDLLDDHAGHEDRFLAPLIGRHSPWLAARVDQEHRIVEETMAVLRRLGDAALSADRNSRRMKFHRLYLAFVAFTGEYLAHMGTEEIEIMPMLARAVPVDELLDGNREVLASIEPDWMERYLRSILPAQNAVDRLEMLSGMRADAPPEAFTGVLALAAEILEPGDHDRLLTDLEVTS